MKIGNLVKSAEAWGPDDYAGCVRIDPDAHGPTEEYYPVGVVYRQHKQRFHRWWVEWVSPEHLAGDKDCMLDDWLEILNEAK